MPEYKFKRIFKNTPDMILGIVLKFSAGVALIAATESLNWRYVHDSPLMIYTGWLVSQGLVPYRDFFDMNMPANYLVMSAMGQIFGWSDAGFRLFDIICLASINLSTYLWLRNTGKVQALVAPVLFTFSYLGFGPDLSLQREYLALVPFTAMVAICTFSRDDISIQGLVISGILSGLALMIKPQFLILCLPVLFYTLTIGKKPFKQIILQRFALFCTGLALIIVTMAIYLVANRALIPFLEIARNYWPLYTHMTGGHEPISGFSRLSYICKSSFFGLMNLYLPMAILGLIVMRYAHQDRRFMGLIIALLLASLIYPAAGGQFWVYHWIPFFYVSICAFSQTALALQSEGKGKQIATTVLILSLLFKSSTLGLGMWNFHEISLHPKHGVPDEIAEFLRSNMRPEDKVQPLDWTAGAIHGMLIARAPLATRFMYDFHFYHHVNSRYIARLRREFIKEFAAAKPRFVVEMIIKDKPIGANTSQDFPELQKHLEMHYKPVECKLRYRIYELVDSFSEKPDKSL